MSGETRRCRDLMEARLESKILLLLILGRVLLGGLQAHMHIWILLWNFGWLAGDDAKP